MKPILALALLLATLALPGRLHAQDSNTPTDSKPAAIDAPVNSQLAEAQELMAAMEADGGIEESVKTALRPTYQKAIDALKEAAQFAATTSTYREAVKNAPELTTKIQEQLEQLPPAEADTLKSSDDVKELRSQLDSQRGALTTLNEQLKTLNADRAAAGNRPALIGERSTAVDSELANIRKQLASPEFSESEKSPGRLAESTLLKAKETRLVQESDMLRLEQASYTVREKLRQAQIGLLDRQVKDGSQLIKILESRVQEGVTKKAQELGSIADIAQLEVPPNDEEALALASEVLTLAKQVENAVKTKPIVTARRIELTSQRQRLTERYSGIREQLQLGGADDEMAQVLVELRGLLETKSLEAAKDFEEFSISQTRLASLKVDFKIAEQVDVEERFANRESDVIAKLVDARDELTKKLKGVFQDLTPELNAFGAETRSYLKQVEVTRDDIAAQLFWIQTSNPLDLNSARELPAGLVWAFSNAHWTELRAAISSNFVAVPVYGSTVLLLAIGLAISRRRFIRGIEKNAERVRRVSTDRYLFTARAFFWSLLLAAPIPLIVGLFASLLAKQEAPSAWMYGISHGVSAAAIIISGACLIDVFCRANGICQAHFRWRPATTKLFRKANRRLAFIYTPLVILTYGTIFAANSMYLGSIGRFGFILGEIASVIVLWRLIYASKGLLELASQNTSRFIGGLRFLWASIAIAFPIGLIWLACLGYMLTALELSVGFMLTLSIVVIGVFLYAFTLRWFMITHRQLALEEALVRRRARRAENAVEATDIDSLGIEEDEPELNLDSIGNQTRHLLGAMFGLMVAIAIVSVWSGMIPLVEALESATLPMTNGMTYFALAQAIAVAIITWVGTKNLPGVLELTILRTTSIDTGTRTAITTICQYAVGGIGLFLVFVVLKLDWTRFSLIAGGLSVGIGFGLQEVVANFICGLILLFERPIRVGDVVTVEGELGTVTKIHLRATTITNFDRGEVVLPNKTLITCKLINWTLTAALNRIVVRVGVAYGTNVDEARRLLLEVAAAHPDVLDDPAPTAIFEQFGDSSLNLLLRAFLPDRSNRDGAINELHTEINKRFAEAEIEIPFPQSVMHVHTESSGKSDAEAWADGGAPFSGAD